MRAVGRESHLRGQTRVGRFLFLSNHNLVFTFRGQVRSINGEAI